MPEPKEQTLILTLLPGISLASALLCPLGLVFLNNRNQFTLHTDAAVLLFLSLVAAVAVLCTVPLALCRRRPMVYSILNALILASAVTVLLQQQFWADLFPGESFGPMFSFDMIFLTLFHILLVLIPFAAAIRFRKQVLNWTGKISAVIILLALTSMTGPLFSNQSAEDYDFKNYTISERDKFTFASDRNVIILVVDCMGERIVKEVLRQYPELQDAFRDFTCFDGLNSPLPRTMYAVPAILTGINFPRTDKNEPADADHAQYITDAYKTENSLFRLCRKNGWRREGYPFMLQTISYTPDTIDNSIAINYEAKKQSAVKILDTALDKYTPFYLKSLLKEYYYIATDPFVQPAQEVNHSPQDVFDRVFFRRLDQEFKVGSHAKGLKYYHLQGAHEPIRTDEKLAMNPNSLKYRQLRGSLRNLELLLRKLKKAGLYDRAAIIVTGDHSERYTPEIAAFIKPPGTRQDKLVFNSIPCQVSDLCGTVSRLAELDPQAASLFDRTPQPGSLNHVRGNPVSVMDFPDWQPAREPFRSIEIFEGIPFILENGYLVIDMGNERFAGLKSIAMTAENLETGRVFQTGMTMSKTANYTRCRLSGLDDGIYRIGVSARYSGESLHGQNPDETCRMIPSFLIVRNGSMKFSENPGPLKPETMKIGQQLEIGPMKLYPQLILPDSSLAAQQTIQLNAGETFGIRVPSDQNGLALEITIQPRFPREGYLMVFANGNMKVKKRIDNGGNQIITVPIPATGGRDGQQVLSIHFKFQSILLNREESQNTRFRISKIALIRSDSR